MTSHPDPRAHFTLAPHAPVPQLPPHSLTQTRLRPVCHPPCAPVDQITVVDDTLGDLSTVPEDGDERFQLSESEAEDDEEEDDDDNDSGEEEFGSEGSLTDPEGEDGEGEDQARRKKKKQRVHEEDDGVGGDGGGGSAGDAEGGEAEGGEDADPGAGSRKRRRGDRPGKKQRRPAHLDSPQSLYAYFSHTLPSICVCFLGVGGGGWGAGGGGWGGWGGGGWGAGAGSGPTRGVT
jgi:hypothetical protein